MLNKHGWSQSIVAADLAETTKDAYSFRYYGVRNWRKCCDLLIARGYHYIEADAILRSKLTRMAADDRAAADKHATASDLARFLDAMPVDGQDSLREWIAECVIAMNFPEPEKLDSRAALRLVYSRRG